VYKDCPCVLSAFYTDEYRKEGPNTIAIDVVHVKREPVPLLLYPGKEYTLIKKNKAGSYSDYTITITGEQDTPHKESIRQQEALQP
jgi:hypothetical protein